MMRASVVLVLGLVAGPVQATPILFTDRGAFELAQVEGFTLGEDRLLCKRCSPDLPEQTLTFEGLTATLVEGPSTFQCMPAQPETCRFVQNRVGLLDADTSVPTIVPTPFLGFLFASVDELLTFGQWVVTPFLDTAGPHAPFAVKEGLATSVPEPASLLLVAIGAVFALRRGRR